MSEHSKKQRLLKTYLTVLALAVFTATALLIGTLFIINNLDAPTGAIGDTGLEFRVFPGEPAAAVARRLQETQAIRSAE